MPNENPYPSWRKLAGKLIRNHNGLLIEDLTVLSDKKLLKGRLGSINLLFSFLSNSDLRKLNQD
jgi:hypothetical protein